MKRVTVKDIAKESGFSIATVSKTLNGTDRVSAETIEKIKRIAAEMGYRSSLSAQSLVRKPRKVAIALFRHPVEVRRLFEEGFNASFDLYGEFGIEPVYHLFEDMREIDWSSISEDAHALIATPGQHFADCADALNAIGERMPLVILQTLPPILLPSRLCEVTVNARVVGAMAAQLLGPGKTAVVTGFADAWIHSENLRGYLEAAPAYGVENLAAEECFDDMDRAYEITRALLLKHPDLDGIFTPSYVSPAICRCARDLDHSLRVVGMDLFANSAACLRDGTLSAAIFQNQQKQAQMALEAVVNSFRGIPAEPRMLVKPEIVLNSNLSCYGWI